MSDGDNQNREHELRERIVSLMRANTQAVRKPIPSNELEELKTAAGRLDKILKAAEDANAQILRTAAARLNQLLLNIRDGKDVIDNLKRRT